ncbi:sigma-54-dependent Fis family transcriptional regulator [Azohydromonas lata]|uniref:sigma-54-dependent Fis family transcriptional regulator n=1 Tax=Azohydromonas lata TaxID=45677 RepID=UPI00082F6D22|nr:sigma-54-dependent Fis family transcriptional regulator [Azohydromonas lata]
MNPKPSRLRLSQLRPGSARTIADLDSSASPTLTELSETLRFSPGDGRIWIEDQRALLLRSATYGMLRRELVASVGPAQARSLFTRVGYNAGARDAGLVRRNWPDSNPANAFEAGPRMHALEGMVRPQSLRFEFDIARGEFYSEHLWFDSVEDDEHIAAFGIGSESACWMLVGYASGYASAFMGKRVLYREVECRSLGHEACRIVGRPADQWDDAEEDLRYFEPVASAQDVRRRLQVATRPVLPEAVTRAEREGEPIGISAAISAARHLIERVAPTQATVLFTGASGVGKELFARTLHRISPRHDQPFIALNCAAIPDALVEAEIFGVERGAYTGATASRPGRFERAQRGTLFLDEIASLSLAAQGKLLRALQERVIERVGGTREITVDVRVVAASNMDLRQEVAAGRFRQDLLFRLNVFPITLPPLKERRDDIPLLMEAFLRRYGAQHGRRVPGFTPQAVRALVQYDFPGNVRELQNLVERAVILVDPDEPIDVHHLFRSGEMPGVTLALGAGGRLVQGAKDTAPVDSKALSAAAPDTPAQQYAQVLRETRYNVAEAARRLGLTRPQLAYRLRKLGLDK